jgi:DNA-binding GntR family transcriptional regulator
VEGARDALPYWTAGLTNDARRNFDDLFESPTRAAAMALTEIVNLNPRPQRLGDQAYDLIKEDIVVCRLRPGVEVTESMLAEHYRLGLAPIRAALSRLSQEGLVTAVPRRGYIVAPITAQSVKEVFDLRLLLEPAAARAAAGHVDGERLKKFGSGPYSQAGKSRDLQFLKDNRDFHVEIAQASGNERLVRIIASLLDEMERLLHLGLFGQRDAERLKIDHELQRQQHKLLIDALIAGDRDAAEQAAAEHVEHSRKLVLEAVMSGVLSVNL